MAAMQILLAKQKRERIGTQAQYFSDTYHTATTKSTITKLASVTMVEEALVAIVCGLLTCSVRQR